MNEKTGYYCYKCDRSEDIDDPDLLPRVCPKCGNRAISTMIVYELKRNGTDKKDDKQTILYVF